MRKKIKKINGKDEKQIYEELDSDGIGENESKEKKEQYEISLNGFAIFKGLKLLGYLENEYGRGLNWIKGNIKKTNLVLEDIKGYKISVEVLESKVETIIDFKKDMPNVKYIINFSCNLAEVISQAGITDKEGVEIATQRQNEIVKKETQAVLKYAQENGIDIFNLSDEIYRKYPKKWKDIKDNWKEVFTNMEIKIEVNSKVERTYHIRPPIRSGVDDEK